MPHNTEDGRKALIALVRALDRAQAEVEKFAYLEGYAQEEEPKTPRPTPKSSPSASPKRPKVTINAPTKKPTAPRKKVLKPTAIVPYAPPSSAPTDGSETD